jgi:hypothetical protein
MKILALALMAGAGGAWAQTPDVEQIMHRVAINQAKAIEERGLYIYTQQQVIRMRRGNGKLAREERREYVVTPDLHRGKKNLAKFEGKYEYRGQFVPYDHPGYEYKDVDIDGELINEMSNDMFHDKKSRDGIARDLFPLSYHEQLKYDFRLVGAEVYRGQNVYRVAFHPKVHQSLLDEDDATWKGEALIDANEYQPVLITTSLASTVPMAVKILLGTNIKGLGFSVSYRKFEDGVWFPVSYGGEFDVRGLFFYRRKISVSMVNTDFHRLDVNSTVQYKTDGQ